MWFALLCPIRDAGMAKGLQFIHELVICYFRIVALDVKCLDMSHLGCRTAKGLQHFTLFPGKAHII
jgi:hypothetical protein